MVYHFVWVIERHKQKISFWGKITMAFLSAVVSYDFPYLATINRFAIVMRPFVSPPQRLVLPIPNLVTEGR
jgi:hypothetical protein